ncbi:Copper amine oxidase N-terminal domain-containing protein [Desulfotomaculum arcticum]|uniref:Copper amine oxidase N-terminal domain-containing protein n=1 Tax=Desulfotruncus arcticus DSM 17038 TaxID=1121424 RepID=A0A1I2NUQ7_9FIRM|nr:Copper amine oxidase N-terminal domain-containing protein [Desulfotomaculum arcticum] [Desulfotruncus arcticus DSM 17038]
MGTLLLIISFLAASPVFASSTFTTSTNQSVNAGLVYPQDDPDQVFNQIMVEIPGKVIPGTYLLNMALPADCYSVARAVYAKVPSGETSQLEGNISAMGIGTPKSGTNAYNEWNFRATFGNEGTMSRFYIELSNFHVPSGVTGDINVSFTASPGSPFSGNEAVKIATVESGTVKISINEENSITSSSGKIGTIRITEDRAKALRSGANSINMKLPNGFTWAKPTSGGVYVWGDAEVVPADADTDFAIDQNGSRLKISCPKAAGSSSPTYYSISGLEVLVENELYAAKGDIYVTVGGDSAVDPKKLLIGKYGGYNSQLTAAELPEIKAGRAGEEIAEFTLEETDPGALTEGRTITLKVGDGVKWSRLGSGTSSDPYLPSDPPIIDMDKSDLQGIELNEWVFAGNDCTTLKTSVKKSTSGANKGATIVFKEACVDVKGNFEGDVNVTVGGSCGLSGVLTVAKSIIPVTISIEGDCPNLVTGKQEQAVADIIIAEKKPNCIMDTGFVTIDGKEYPKREIWLEFPQGVTPTRPEKMEVLEGDIILDKYTLRDNVVPGRWYMVIETKYRSFNPSKIKFSGIKFTLDRSVPDGPLEVKLKGPGLLQSADVFSGPDYMSKVAVASNGTAAPVDLESSSVFKIGDKKYTVGGVEKAMDIAPFVENGRTYLPMRFAAYALGLSETDILWEPSTSTATFIKGNKTVQVKDGSDKLYINGVSITMDVPAQVKEGYFVVPIRFIGQAFSVEAKWDNVSQTVTLSI